MIDFNQIIDIMDHESQAALVNWAYKFIYYI